MQGCAWEKWPQRGSYCAVFRIYVFRRRRIRFQVSGNRGAKSWQLVWNFIKFKSEPQNRRISNNECRRVGSLLAFVAFSAEYARSVFFYKIDRSTQKLTTGRIHYFRTCPPPEDSIFIIRYSLFQSFFFDLTGRFFWPAAGLNLWAFLILPFTLQKNKSRFIFRNRSRVSSHLFPFNRWCWKFDLPARPWNRCDTNLATVEPLRLEVVGDDANLLYAPAPFV